MNKVVTHRHITISSFGPNTRACVLNIGQDVDRHALINSAISTIGPNKTPENFTDIAAPTTNPSSSTFHHVTRRPTLQIVAAVASIRKLIATSFFTSGAWAMKLGS